MKISTFVAIFSTVALLGMTAWLALDARRQADSMKNQLDAMHRRDMAAQVQAEATPAHPAQASAKTAAALQAKEKQLVAQQQAHSTPGDSLVPPPPPAEPSFTSPEPLTASGSTGMPHIVVPPPPAEPTNIPPPTTAWEGKVSNLPAVGKVTDYQKDYGFVVVTAVGEGKFVKGEKLAVRRGSSLLAKIGVSSVDGNSAVADIDPKSIPVGVTLEVNDEVVHDLSVQ